MTDPKYVQDGLYIQLENRELDALARDAEALLYRLEQMAIALQHKVDLGLEGLTPQQRQFAIGGAGVACTIVRRALALHQEAGELMRDLAPVARTISKWQNQKVRVEDAALFMSTWFGKRAGL